jgi:hypothetical protein
LLGLRLVFRLLRFLGVGEPEIAIVIEHKSQSDQQKSQSNDHRAPLFPFLIGTRARRSQKRAVRLSNYVLEV